MAFDASGFQSAQMRQVEILFGLEESDRIALGLEGSYLQALKARRDFILCGDINIAHKEADLKNWRSNQKNSGFLPEERAWMDRLFGPLGFVDAFRVVNQDSRAPLECPCTRWRGWHSPTGNSCTRGNRRRTCGLCRCKDRGSARALR